MSAHDHRTPGAQLAALAGGAALIGHLLPGLAGVSRANGEPVWPILRRRLGIEDRTAGGRGYALTFDDGPHPQGTPAVLEILARERVPATFFLVGEQVQRDPALAREIVQAGHQIALHCNRHRNLLRLTPWQVREDIARAESIIEAATDRSPVLYRPPYGALSRSALQIARGRGWRTLLWSRWGRDWDALATPVSIAERVSEGAQPGAVLLLHDADEYSAPGSWQRTASALPRVLDTLAACGLAPAEL